MSASYPLDRSANRRLACVFTLTVFTVLMTTACSDGADPVAPAKATPPTPGPVAADLYPGTTNTEFYGVKVQSEAMGFSIKFDYTGITNPVLTVGTAQDVFASQIKMVSPKKQAPGYWTATVNGLESGNLYYFRLDNLKSTYWASAKTLRRDVTFDLDSVYVSNDADPGAPCGEWFLKAILTDKVSPNNFFFSERSFCSGNTYRFNGTDGVHTYKDITKYAWLNFEVREEDNCFPDQSYCLEYNDTFGQEFNLVSGTYKFDQSLKTIHRPRARFWGRLIVAYNAW